ncbi:MAG: methylated-DNA--[protein]-cysteine S-methyltransferase [Phascolarctobacterium sp.]|nr:methylated-DNA--[protein]-cysteine S-methyltransferase [Phascolarctobacterium sp.]
MIYVTKYQSPLGELTLASTGDGLIGLWIAGQKYFFSRLEQEEIIYEENESLREAAAWLDDYFANKRPEISALRLAPRGSDFAQRVWLLLREIPYGETITYGELAQKIAKLMGKKKMSAQAVGGAVGHNPLSIIVPCHRVVGANGSLTGYAGGIHLKVKLLEHEGVDMSKFFIPKRGTAL